MIWVLWFDSAGAAVFVIGLVADVLPPRPHWPAALTFHRPTKGR